MLGVGSLKVACSLKALARAAVAALLLPSQSLFTGMGLVPESLGKKL